MKGATEKGETRLGVRRRKGGGACRGCAFCAHLISPVTSGRVLVRDICESKGTSIHCGGENIGVGFEEMLRVAVSLLQSHGGLHTSKTQKSYLVVGVGRGNTEARADRQAGACQRLKSAGRQRIAAHGRQQNKAWCKKERDQEAV